jgi:hypothetical protein
MKTSDDFGISLEHATSELSERVGSAVDFMSSEFSKEWETGEAYFAGKSDIPTEEGRSSIVKTEVRDTIRALMPSVMRTFLHARLPVQYLPTNIRNAAFAEQQSHWATNLFYSNGGYMTLYNAVQESFKLKAGPVKTYWLENPEPEHIVVTGISAAEVAEYAELEDVIVDSVEEREVPVSGDIVYDLRATRYYENGKICNEAFPIYEFFVERKADNLEDFVHGHQRTVTVSEAMEMGLEYDDWRSLSNDDPRENQASGADQQRRGYNASDSQEADADIMNHEFLLTEAYCKYDMDGDGVSERYVFYMGGAENIYLHHERIEDFAIDIFSVDPIPFTVIGRSITDVTKASQDTETSLLRSIIDNALMANNPRPAADPTKVNFQDLMNNGIGAPIRTKGRAEIQYADIPFTAQNLIPLLQYLEMDAQTRVGATKASQGLDPDAMQSTDKDAVRNTIQLSQGQVELMVRNLIETGLIPMFKRMLRLSMRHMDKRQMIRLRGALVPVDISSFDPNMVAEPTVGLGTASPEQKLGTLQFIYGEQQKYLQTLGLDNPFTSLSQVYNTIEDMVELGGVINVGRYFNYIDRQTEAEVTKRMKEDAAKQAQAAQENQPMDPGKSLVMIESMKSRARMQELMSETRSKEMELQFKALNAAEDNDIRRDELVQKREIELAKIGQGVLNDTIRQEQAATDPSRPASGPRSVASGSQS